MGPALGRAREGRSVTRRRPAGSPFPHFIHSPSRSRLSTLFLNAQHPLLPYRITYRTLDHPPAVPALRPRASRDGARRTRTTTTAASLRPGRRRGELEGSEEGGEDDVEAAAAVEASDGTSGLVATRALLLEEDGEEGESVRELSSRPLTENAPHSLARLDSLVSTPRSSLSYRIVLYRMLSLVKKRRRRKGLPCHPEGASAPKRRDKGKGKGARERARPGLGCQWMGT